MREYLYRIEKLSPNKLNYLEALSGNKKELVKLLGDDSKDIDNILKNKHEFWKVIQKY